MKKYQLKPEEFEDSFRVRLAMAEYFESLGIHNGDCGTQYITLTKKEVYNALGMNKPSKKFDLLWNSLAYDRGELISYDKDIKKWIWL